LLQAGLLQISGEYALDRRVPWELGLLCCGRGLQPVERRIADVSNYVIARFGAKPSSITAEQVHGLREMK